MRSFGVNVVTRSLNVRSGAMVARSKIVSWGNFPLDALEVEFHRGKSWAFVSNAQIALGVAFMVIPTTTSIRNVLRVVVALPLVRMVKAPSPVFRINRLCQSLQRSL
jgi:hypothetical protein